MQSLLTARNEKSPSGENLEYETVFQDLLMAAQPGEEKQAGEEIIAAEPPNATAVQEKALAVLELSHDLRAAVFLASAEMRIDGFEGLAKVTGYIKGCLTDFWDTCHPQLDADDENDPTMRVNAIIGLTDTTFMLNEVRLAPLTQSNTFGKIGLRSIAIAAGKDTAKDGEQQLDAASISAAFQDTDPEMLKMIHESATAALDDVNAINAVFDEQIPGLGPDLSSLIKVLKLAVTRLSEEIGVPVDEEAEASAIKTGGAPAVSATPSVITSPHDVEKALGRIIEYYERHEPSSPIPILLLRAQKLVNADFLTIVKELAPGGVDNVNLIGGITPESSY